MALAGVGQHFSRNFDQYTIMCVFGSVVGCVVLPLMAQVCVCTSLGTVHTIAERLEGVN